VLQTDFEEVYDSAAFEIVHIDTDNASASALHNHWDEHNPTFPVLTGCASLFQQYGDGYIPHNVILDTDGIVRYTDSGFNESAMHAIINQYMSVDFPVFTIQQLTLTDEGNGDGRPDGGETISYNVTLRNSPIAVPATGTTLTMTCDDPAVTILGGTVAYPAANPGDVVSGSGVFSFSVAEGIEPHWATFTFSYEAAFGGGTAEGDLTHVQRMGRPDLLVVDSDGGTDDNETFVQTALDNMAMPHDVWSVAGALSSDEMGRYSRVIWLGGTNETDMSDAEEEAVRDFVAAGGQLLLSSQYLSGNANRLDLLQDLFGLTLVDDDGGNIFLMACPVEDPYFGGAAMVVSGNQGANNNEDPDVLASDGTATVFATWNQNPVMGQPAAAYTTAPGVKAIFCGFPIEANRVHSSAPGSMTAQGFLERAFSYFGEVGMEPSPVVARDFRLLGAVPNPFNPATTLSFQLDRAGAVELGVYNLAGQEVRRLDAGARTAGTHQLTLDGRDLASGLYLVRLLVAGEAQDAMKVMLVK